MSLLKEFYEGLPLFGWYQLLAFSLHVLAVDKPFDGLGTRGRGAQSELCQRFLAWILLLPLGYGCTTIAQ